MPSFGGSSSWYRQISVRREEMAPLPPKFILVSEATQRQESWRPVEGKCPDWSVDSDLLTLWATRNT